MILTNHYPGARDIIMGRAQSAYDLSQGKYSQMLLNYNIALHLTRRHKEYSEGDLMDAVELFRALIEEHREELENSSATAGTMILFGKAANELACCLLAVPWMRYAKAEALAIRWMEKHQGKRLLWSSSSAPTHA